ncbi:MAG: di-heme oxidoredictase family protein [Bacteroidota bacterium]
MNRIIYAVLFFVALLLLVRCSGELRSGLRPEVGEERSGGEGTILDASPNAFSFQVSNLTDEQGLFFFTGNSLFNQNWVTAPASATARDGLGPLFNAKSCSGCHFKDGRGKHPTTAGEINHGLLLRLSVGNDANGAPLPDPNYGGQLQDQSILSVQHEAAFEISYENIPGTYPDGTAYLLRKPIYTLKNLTQGKLSATQISPRIANQIIGLGLLEALEERTLLDLVEQQAAIDDGVTGKANYVWNIEAQKMTIGRFGWKANQPTLRQQVASAFAGDIGITSSLFPEDDAPTHSDYATQPNGGEPEITDENLGRVTLYSSTLAVPGRRDWDDKEVLAGKQLFESINCNSCHVQKLTTGKHPQFDALSYQTIRPYTDLLLHDMGEALADNSPEYLATGREWRTPPLWGIGLFDIVNGHTNYLHDGRARNLEEAILWHGGEAELSKQAFMQLNQAERNQLIQFLNSL